jgi:hypothetical protein
VSIFHGLNGAIEELRNSILSHGVFLLAAKGRKNQAEATMHPECTKLQSQLKGYAW